MLWRNCTPWQRMQSTKSADLIGYIKFLPWEQLNGCSVTRPFLSLWRVWLARLCSASLPQGHKELTFWYLLNDPITQTVQIHTPSILTMHITLAHGCVIAGIRQIVSCVTRTQKGSGHETKRRHDTITVTPFLSPPLSFPPSITSGSAEHLSFSEMLWRNSCSPCCARDLDCACAVEIVYSSA